MLRSHKKTLCTPVPPPYSRQGRLRWMSRRRQKTTFYGGSAVAVYLVALSPPQPKTGQPPLGPRRQKGLPVIVVKRYGCVGGAAGQGTAPRTTVSSPKYTRRRNTCDRWRCHLFGHPKKNHVLKIPSGLPTKARAQF